MTRTQTKPLISAGMAVILGFGIITLFMGSSTPPPDVQGTWEGTILLGGWGVQAGESPKTRLVMRITGTNGVYHAEGDDIDRGLKDVQVSLFTYKYPRVHAEISATHDVYDAKINHVGTKISGKWTENNASGSLILERTTNPPPFPEPLADQEFVPRAGSDLQGFWNGVIQTVGKGLKVNIKIAEATDETYRADFYVPSQGNVRQPTSVNYDGTMIKLMPMAGYGMFQGQLSAGGKEMEGVWIQNGGKIATTFKRAN